MIPFGILPSGTLLNEKNHIFHTLFAISFSSFLQAADPSENVESQPPSLPTRMIRQIILAEENSDVLEGITLNIGGQDVSMDGAAGSIAVCIPDTQKDLFLSGTVRLQGYLIPPKNVLIGKTEIPSAGISEAAALPHMQTGSYDAPFMMSTLWRDELEAAFQTGILKLEWSNLILSDVSPLRVRDRFDAYNLIERSGKTRYHGTPYNRFLQLNVAGEGTPQKDPPQGNGSD